MEEEASQLFLIFPNFLNHYTPNKEKLVADQCWCRNGKRAAKRRSLKGQGALGLKRTDLKQSDLETQGFGRVMLRALCSDDDKVYMDVD